MQPVPLQQTYGPGCAIGLSGEEDELVEEVLKVIRASLVLIGNSSKYVSQLRRRIIIEAMPQTRLL